MANREYMPATLTRRLPRSRSGKRQETVKREVMEEVGLHVKNLRYYKVNRGHSPTHF